ncbi:MULTISPECIES: LysE family translocator [Azorhizobium]|jgi:RhtB (resistance to homoserine/threonine) family protein|uniref:LysE family translocator n=1 Tax=Azorhizobium TaxID=6 RepID=UPI00105F334F|nr:LysE family translocator [Azorhizobium sp. AG788]TDU00696.1 RhtB (resistance to homoserine/threonine) family protein [Azorhizobium sp. AG788]
MSSHLAEFLTIMAVFSLAAVTPGPDFAMVVRQSVVRGRRAGIITSFGIGAAIFFHAAYTVAGIGLLVAHSLLAFNVLKWAGAAYLFYVGVKTWRAPPPSYQVDLADAPAPAVAPRRYGDASDFTLGFLTNALNPKAVLFFLSIFTTVVSPTTPQSMQMGYAAGMAGLLVVWFTLVSVFFTGRAVQAQLSRIGRWFNRITGAALVGLGIRLAFQRASAH